MEFKVGDIVVMKCGIMRIVGDIVSSYGELYFRAAHFKTYNRKMLTKLSDCEIKKATIEEKVVFIRCQFSWGDIINVHLIEDYQIIEAIYHGEIRYHPYVNFKDMHCSYESLEKAIVGAISYKYDGPNSKADVYFWKMIDKDYGK